MSRVKFRNMLQGAASGGARAAWISAIVFATVAMTVAANTNTNANAKDNKAKAKAKTTATKKKPAKKLTGAQLYAINCARCHKERYPTERTDAQWQTIILHMRVHANLPGASAQKIVDYLKSAN